MKSGRWILTLLLCTLLIAGLAGYKIFDIRSAIAFAESFPEHSETVKTSQAKPVAFQPTVQVMGEIVQPRHITLRNELPGRIATIETKPSVPVKKGQVLLRQDISEEQANIQSANARLKLARLEFQRLKKLRDSNNASQAELDKATVELQVIESELDVLNVTVRKKTIKAPFDGIMGIHQLEQGSYLQMNTEVASFVGDGQWLWVDFSVPQFYELLDFGTTVDVQLTGLPVTTLKADIIARDPVLAVHTRTHQYRARFPTPDKGFAHNSSVQVTLPQGTPQNLIAIGLEAIQYDETGSFVYLLHPDDDSGGYRAERRNVTVDRHDHNRVLIADGLQDGETLAVAGAFKLHPGLLVYPDTDNTRQHVTER